MFLQHHNLTRMKFGKGFTKIILLRMNFTTSVSQSNVQKKGLEFQNLMFVVPVQLFFFLPQDLSVFSLIWTKEFWIVNKRFWFCFFCVKTKVKNSKQCVYFEVVSEMNFVFHALNLQICIWDSTFSPISNPKPQSKISFSSSSLALKKINLRQAWKCVE